MPKLNLKKTHIEEQYPIVEDIKLRLTLSTFSDKYSKQVRDYIYDTYNDLTIMSLYRGIRRSGIHEKGGKTGARYRKIVDFPNHFIYDFVNTVMEELYGPDWIKNNKALRHDLVKPFWIVNKL